MNKKELLNEFDNYVLNNFDINLSGISRKYYHSKRVADLSQKLAKAINLNKKEIFFSYKIGLLHDIGRFTEFKVLNRFNDAIFNHSVFGAELLKENDYYKKYDITSKEFDIVYNAVKYHGLYQIGDDYQDNDLCKIIRDADKVDIYYLETLDDYVFSDGNTSIKDINIEMFNKNLLIKNENIFTLGDKVIANLALVFDLNYDLSYKIIKENNYINKIYNKTPHKEEFKKYFDYINDYIEKRLTC